MCQFNEVTDICQWPPVIRIISVLHSHRLSSGKSALSSQFRSAAVTIAVHRCGDEAGWWNKIGIDPTTAARVLWRETHPLPRTTGQPTAKLTNPMCRPALHEFLPQIEVNRRLRTEPGKQASRCNAVRHGLTAETVISALEDAEDYKAFEATITADYDAQSAVERELVLRLASLLWRLRRATTMETGLFEIQAEHLRDRRQTRK